MQKIINLIPEIELDEAQFLTTLLKDKNEEELHNFVNIYRSRRRDPQVILLTALLGFIGIAGIHRFIINNIGMGVLYFFTAGLCFIGTIVDLINYKNLTFEYNQKTALQVNSFFTKY